jgi:flagellar protein FliL
MSKAAPQVTAPQATRGRMTKWIILIVIVLCSLGAGMLAPRFLAGPLFGGDGSKKEANKAKVPFGEVVVNLNEERLTRYLRVKIMLIVDGNREKELTDRITNNKAFLRNWLISYLMNKSLKEVTGTTAANKLRREIMEQFNELLDKSGPESIQEVLFEEFVVQ